MAETKISQPTDPNLIALLAAFQESIKTIVAEIRKPPHDPIKEAQKVREAETKIKALKEYWEKKIAKRKNCAHSRQDGTCVIAWAQQSDNYGTVLWRGYCPHCDSTFTPEDPDYSEQRRRPRGLMENVRVVG